MQSMNKNESIVSIQEQKQNEFLENGLLTADRFINKNYLINLTEQKVVPIDKEEKRINFIRLFYVDKIVYDKKENVNDKLISVYSALQNVDSSAILIIDGDKNGIHYYIGVRTHENAATAGKILEKSFLGNFAGSELRSLKNSEIEEVMKNIVESEHTNSVKNVSCVTVVPSMRDEDKEKFVQGMEKFIDTMQGENYTAYFLARPVSKKELEIRKRGFEELYSSLSPFVKTSLQYGENFSKAVSDGMFENFSHSINNSISNTNGGNSGQNYSKTHGINRGTNMGGGGFGFNIGSSDSTTKGYSSGTSWSKSVTEGTADTTGTGTNKSETMTEGDSRTLTLEHQNKSVQVLLETIDEQLKRLQLCEAFGVWECSAYFIADDIQTSVVAANTYKALMLGEETQVENSFVNVWGVKFSEQAKQILEYLHYGVHPLIEIAPENGFDSQYVTPGNFISGSELPLLLGIPNKSVTGLTVNSMAEFGRNVYIQNKKKDEKKIRIGQIHHMGKTENNEVNLSLNSLTSHCFITGSTGSGKSNTVYCLLERFINENIPFLVIEPAKGEYKTAFGGLENINIFTTNPRYGRMLKLNPFRFDSNIHILEHLDRLIEIFNACWEMYAAMPAILKDAVERIYSDAGWDLLNSVYIGAGSPKYPTFEDLLQKLPFVINSSGYSSDTKGDYTGALVTRVASLTNGITGQIFCDCYDIDDSVMFDENTIVDLSRVGSMETKSLIMGILVLKLNEYRMANSEEANSHLRHITVLEEAHNLLKRTSDAQSQESANLIGKSVEMICNGIAEMRTYGEGFIIVDQSPTSVDIAAIKNTNTKILMRLPEKNDCEAIGNSVGLDDEQIKEFSKLPTGVAVVMQNNWLEAVLTQIDYCDEKYKKKLELISFEECKMLNTKVIYELMIQYIEKKQMNERALFEIIDSVSISVEKKKEMKNCIHALIPRLEERDVDLFSTTLLNLSGSKSVFDSLKKKILTHEGEYIKESVWNWNDQLKNSLYQYLSFEDDILNTVIRYLIYAKSFDKKDLEYDKIYDLLYRGGIR